MRISKVGIALKYGVQANQISVNFKRLLFKMKYQGSKKKIIINLIFSDIDSILANSILSTRRPPQRSKSNMHVL